MVCKTCGGNNDDNAKFCEICGLALDEVETGETVVNEAPVEEVVQSEPVYEEPVQPALEYTQEPQPAPVYTQEPQPTPVYSQQPQPQVIYVQQADYTQNSDPRKSKITAGLFGIFLGGFGVHNFYLGYITKAIIQVSVTGVCLLLSLCTAGISTFGIIGIEIWGLVEGIMILAGGIKTDGKGIPLKE